MKVNSKGRIFVKLLNILAISAIWLIIALPVLVNSQIKANEQAVILKIQKISEACEKFKLLNKSYPKDLESLIVFIREDMASPGYVFVYNYFNVNEYMLLASPKYSGLTGQSGFYADNGQNILKVRKDLVPAISNSIAEKNKAALPKNEIVVSSYNDPVNTNQPEMISANQEPEIFSDTNPDRIFNTLVANLEATTASFYNTSLDIVRHSYSPVNASSNSSTNYLNLGYIREPANNPPLKQKQTPELPVKPSPSITQGKETEIRSNN